MTKRALLAPLALLSFLVVVSPARAADDDAQRKALVDSAVQARDAGDHARALALAQSADALRSTSSLTRFIAEEHEKLGRLPDAYDAARRCLRLAEGEEPSANHDAVLVGCRSIAADLRARVGVVTLAMPGAPPSGLTLRVAGATIAPTSEPLTVMPGNVRIEATAPGRPPFATSVVIAPGGEATVRVELGGGEPAASPGPSPDARGGHAKSLFGPIVAGTGVAALAAGGILALVANGKYTDFKSSCTDANPCSPDDPRKASIQQLDTIAIVSAIAGGALVATGVTLWVLDRGHAAEPPAAAWLVVAPTGAALRGSF